MWNYPMEPSKHITMVQQSTSRQVPCTCALRDMNKNNQKTVSKYRTKRRTQAFLYHRLDRHCPVMESPTTIKISKLLYTEIHEHIEPKKPVTEPLLRIPYKISTVIKLLQTKQNQITTVSLL